MRKSKNAQSKSKNTRGRSASPTNVISPNVQASSGSSSTSAPKPVAKTTQHPSNKHAKTSDTSTMDVDPPAPLINPQQELLIDLNDTSTSSPAQDNTEIISSPTNTAAGNPTANLSGSPSHGENPTEDNGKRVKNPIQDADPNAMIVDQPNKADQTTDNLDQQEFSLNVTQFCGTAWAPIEAFSDLKLSLSNLKNKLLDERKNFPGLINVKRGTNSDTKSHVLAIFNNETDFNTFLATKLTDFNSIQFTKHVPRHVSSPIIDRQLLLSKIPLFLNKNDIHAYFKTVGDIEKINLSPYKGYLSGSVTFTMPDALSDFRDLLWMVFIKGHACLARPANLLPAEKKLRHEYVAILSGLMPIYVHST